MQAVIFFLNFKQPAAILKYESTQGFQEKGSSENV